MRFLIATALVLSCSLCLAEDFPEDTNEIKSLTAKQAADLVMVVTHVRKYDTFIGLALNGLTSIDKDVARELAKFKGERMLSLGLTSIDKDVAQELAKFKGQLRLYDLTSIDKDVAQELAKFEGRRTLSLGLTSIDKDVAQELAKINLDYFFLYLTSIDKDVAQELAKFKGDLYLSHLTSIDKDVAQELAKFKGGKLVLEGLTSIDEVTLAYLKSNPRIFLAEKYRDKKN